VLVTKSGSMLFLDFDKACRKIVKEKDFEQMLWRLNRFVEKKERSGELIVAMQERTLFLRTFERLSGYHIIDNMQKRSKTQRLSYRLGWLLESILYRKDPKINS
jgi:hypothetical protein